MFATKLLHIAIQHKQLELLTHEYAEMGFTPDSETSECRSRDRISSGQILGFYLINNYAVFRFIAYDDLALTAMAYNMNCCACREST